MFRGLIVSLFLLLAGGAGAAHAAHIVVTIDGMHSAKGNLYVALFSRAEQFPDGDYSDQHVVVPASTKPVTVSFDAPAGTYAVGAYHDENANHRLDTNFIGYPTEGYALSNGIRAVISRPRFMEASFSVGPDGRAVTLHIAY